MFICEGVTLLRLLYIFLSRGRCPAKGLHAIIINSISVDQRLLYPTHFQVCLVLLDLDLLQSKVGKAMTLKGPFVTYNSRDEMYRTVCVVTVSASCSFKYARIDVTNLVGIGHTEVNEMLHSASLKTEYEKEPFTNRISTVTMCSCAPLCKELQISHQ
jgi:hypothetical protein